MVSGEFDRLWISKARIGAFILLKMQEIER